MNPNQQPQPFSPNFNFNQMAPSWGGRYPWTPNFKFPANPVTQTHAPHNTQATAAGVQQAMQKRSAQDNSAKRLSATGEKSGVTYKHDNEGHATGQSAFDTLDGYMKKAGLNSFQQQFFTRLIQHGMSETQIKQCVKRAGAEFGEKVADELNSGFEKLAAVLPVLGTLGRGALEVAKYFAPKFTATATRFGVGPAAAQAARQAQRSVVRGATNAAATAKDLASTQGLKNFGKGFMNQSTPAAGRAMQAGQGARRFLTGPGAKGQMLQGAVTGAANPYTGMGTWRDEQGNFDYMKALSSVGGGALLSRYGGKPLGALQRRALVGEGVGAGAGIGANLMGFDVDTNALARAGFLGGGLAPRSIKSVLPKDMFQGLSPGLQAFARKPLVTSAGKGVLDKVDPFGNLYRAGASGFKKFAPWAKNNPGQATMVGGGLAAGAGGLAAPIVARNVAQQGIADTQEALLPLAKYTTQTLDNVNRVANNPLGSMMGGVGNYLQQNPMMAMALLGGLGAAGGGMMGGGTGATLGGIGLPLAYMLASGQNPLKGFMGGGQNVAQTQAMMNQAGENQAAANSVNNPLAQLPTRQQENEIARQQQMQQQGNPAGDQAAAQMAAQATGQPTIEQLLAKASPQQMQMLQDPSVPEELKNNLIQELAMG